MSLLFLRPPTELLFWNLNDHTKPDGSSFIFVCKYPYIDRGNAYSFKSVILSDSAGYGC